ncbi:MAG TPA: sensor histidine kinase [Candidatus Ozemobacteraceae bacterium]|nr:sensor histidine kinase [Candidatus Ozemobacteraceae bacterium]
MTETWKEQFSQRIMNLKTGFGSLLELVEHWLAALSREDERQKLIDELVAIVSAKESGLREEIRTECLRKLDALAGKGTAVSVTSPAYRLNLQKKFQHGIERLNREVDDLMIHLGKLLDTAAEKESPAGYFAAQEDERKRISREIHDGPAQALASLTMRIDFCLENMSKPEVLQPELSDLKESIIRCLRDIRRFIFDLRPMAIDDLGLIPTLEQYTAGFRTRSGLKIHVHVDGERFSLGTDRELAVFRVIQEAVNNAHHHAAAKNVHIFLTFEGERKTLVGVVKDDGTGFQVDVIRRQYSTLKKMGLQSMEERIHLAGGTFELVSNAGEGTIVSFQIPL